MRIDKVEIKSYRSISHVKFSMDKIGLIVGANDTGKSNIFKAIALFFNYDGRTTLDDVNCITKRIQTDISITFVDLNLSEQKLFSKWNKGSSQSTISIRKMCKVNKKPKYIERNTNNQISETAITTFLQGRFVLIPSLRDASDEFAHSAGSLFYEFITDKNKTLSRYRVDNMQKDWDKGLSLFKKHLNRYLREIIDKTSTSLGIKGLKVNVNDSIDKILHSLILNITDKHGDIPLNQHGHGIQSMLVMALYEALASSDNLVLIALEEPENHLHPNLIHHLMLRLSSISSRRQVLISTHSPIIASHIQIDNLIRVTKNEDGLTGTTVFHDRGNKALRNKTLKLLNPIKNELLFADKVILCEGETECLLLPILGTRLGQEFDILKDNIACIHCDGEAFGAYIKLLDQFKIPWIILCDNAYWKDGKWHQMITQLGLDKVGRKSFNKIKPSNNLAFQLVKNILKNKFRTICLSESIEDVILGQEIQCQQAVAGVLKLVCPGKYKEIVSDGQVLSRQEIVTIMKKNKTIWAKALSTNIEIQHVSKELKELFHTLKKTKYANSLIRKTHKLKKNSRLATGSIQIESSNLTNA